MFTTFDYVVFNSFFSQPMIVSYPVSDRILVTLQIISIYCVDMLFCRSIQIQCVLSPLEFLLTSSCQTLMVLVGLLHRLSSVAERECML